MITQSKLGNLLREHRVQRRQSLRAVSERAKISHSHLEKIETGKVKPTLVTLLRLLDANEVPDLVWEVFGVTVADKINNDKLEKAIVSQILIEAGVDFEMPPPLKGNPDFILKLGPGRIIKLEVKSSTSKTKTEAES